jgi:glycosyltransferase involved in cell wall biosynthesis
MPVAEAMACGLPVITSRQAGVAELIHDGTDGFILRNAEDFQELAQIVKRLREDNILWETFGEASTKAAAQWNWDRNAADVWELLEETCARKAPPRSTKS